MRIRLFAAVLLAPLALGACDRNPIGTGARLVGEWESDGIPLLETLPNGSTNAIYRESWSFRDDGAYAHSNVLIDGTTGRRWVVAAEAGSWRTTDDELSRVIREVLHVDDPAGVPPEVPVMDPVDPQLVRAGYELEGPTLTIYPPCPPNASCIAPLPLHRAPVAF
ncbi:MAG TPA: hypothetical protein VM890_08925 [Longimicrobium sp.]|jgi:hypothetical protein|nr:hypothetical protein [Longimicrobium sp.]